MKEKLINVLLCFFTKFVDCNIQTVVSSLVGFYSQRVCNRCCIACDIQKRCSLPLFFSVLTFYVQSLYNVLSLIYFDIMAWLFAAVSGNLKAGNMNDRVTSNLPLHKLYIWRTGLCLQQKVFITKPVLNAFWRLLTFVMMIIGFLVVEGQQGKELQEKLMRVA